MNYSIKYGKKKGYTIWLDKNGNKYTVGDYDTIDSCSTFTEVFDNFDSAEQRFLALCKEKDLEISDVEHDGIYF